MSKWKVTTDIDHEVYEAWRRHLSERGVQCAGKYSTIRKLNSEMLTDAIKAKMDDGQ
jgi:hypothetical protein